MKSEKAKRCAVLRHRGYSWRDAQEFCRSANGFEQAMEVTDP